MIEIKNLIKTYSYGKNKLNVIDDFNLKINKLPHIKNVTYY